MPFQQDLTGSIEPNAKTWADATPEQRLWYYGQMAKLAERKKRVELMQAIGRFGVMDPRKHPRADGASGPVMDPHGGASRAFKLLASSATASSCKLYWRAGGAIVSKSGTVYFTDILGYHADGKVRGAPTRDVRLSDDSIATLRAEGEGIWRRRPKQSGAKAPKSSATQPTPTKLSTKGPIQVGGNPFRTILPPKGGPVPPPRPKPAPKSGIERAVELATEKGIRIDPAGYELLKYRFSEFELGGIPAVFFPDPHRARIIVNEKYSGWAEIDRKAAEAYQKNWWSTGHPDQVIQHEIGHAVHHKATGDAAFNATLSARFDAAQVALVETQVSRYATTNPGEFVAEVYAGRAAGREFSPEVMALYRSFGGPG